MGHPEPITLSRNFPTLRRSLNVHSGPDWVFDHLKEVSARFQAGEITLHEGAEELVDPPKPAVRGPREAHHRLPVEWALAVGNKGGVATSVVVSARFDHASQMGGRTGTPVACGVELIRQGLVKDVGVHAPETAFDPSDFFGVLGPLVDDSVTGADDFLRLETSRG